jgi:thymidylate kinase
MANLIIIEGLSRTGKSTICSEISKRNGFRNLSVVEKMPEYVENLPDFYHGMHVYSNAVFKAFPEETFILDRSFLSEQVYSRFFQRPSYIQKGSVINDILFDNNFILVYLSNRYRNYIDRSPKDKIVYTEDQFLQQKDLFEWFFDQHQKHFNNDRWQDRFLRLSSADNTIEECIDQINLKIKQHINPTKILA